ncbi:retrovirus-related pol polyprotein from transposon TNT 1-94 [Tanacetum coccineum]
MDSDKYLEGQSMQRPPLFESDSFIYWKNRFETYVKSKDLDLWHVITNGDFQPIEQNPETKLDEVIPFEKQSDDLKKKLAKNNEAKMVIYNALPRKEYERIFMLRKNLVMKSVRLRSEDEEYAMAVRDFKKFFKRRGVDLEPNEWIKDSGCSKHITGNQKLFSSYKAYNRGNVIFGSNLLGNIIGKGKICDNKCRVTFSKPDSEITKDGKVIGRGYSQNSKAYIILNKHTRKVKESLNVTFDETPPPSKTSPMMDDDLDKDEAIKVTEKKNLENNIVDETLEIDKTVNIKESRNHPLENIVSMQEELNQFIANDVWELVPQPRNMTIIGTKWVFRNKLDENGIVSLNKARLVAQGSNQQEGINYDENYAPVARLESTRILLAYFSKKQTALAISTTKAEYVSAGKACQQALWIKQALIDYEKGHISIEKVTSVDNIADILTKPLKRESFNYLREMTLEDELRSIHEGRPVSHESTKYDNIQNLFQIIKLLNIYELHEGNYPRFLLEFYSSIEITKDDDQNVFLTFWALKRTFKISLESFALILSIPCEGECSYSKESSLDSLKTNQESNTPYQTHIPTPNEIIQSITTTGQTIFPNKILKEELRHDMRSWNEIIQDNAFGAQNDSPFLLASSCHMMYCVDYVILEEIEMPQSSFHPT